MRTRRLGKLEPDQAWKVMFQDNEWSFKIGVGGLVNASAMLVAVINPLLMPASFALMALASGYILRLLRFKVLDPESKLPDWNDLFELFMSGLNWLAIQFGLLLLLVSAATLFLILGATMGAVKVDHPSFLLWALGCLLVVAFIWLVTDFMTPFLMVNYATEEKIGAGFNFPKVIRRAKQNPARFLLAWLLGMGVKWAAVIVPSLTILGVFLVPSFFFVAQVMSATFAAQVWGPEK